MKLSEFFAQQTAPKKVETYDRTDLENTALCPFMAKSVRDKRVQDISPMAEVGTETHRILEESVKACGSDREAVAGWIEAEAAKSRPDIQPDVIKSLRGISETLRKIRLERIVAIEKQYSTEIIPGVVITTCIDMILAGSDETIIHINDYKTGWKKRTNTEAADAYQTRQFCYILWRELPKLNTIHIWYNQTRFGTVVYARLERERDYFNFEGRIMSAVQRRQQNSDEAWPSLEKCPYCPATEICPHVIGIARDINKDPAGVLDQYVAVESAQSIRKDQLDAYCKKHGGIQSKNIVFEYRPAKPKITFKPYKAKVKDQEPETENES